MRSVSFLVAAVVILIVVIGNIGFYTGRTVGQMEPDPDDFMTAQVTIEDAVYGEDPYLHPQRTIHKPFRGRWTVEVNTDEGEYVCSSTGQTVYTPDSRAPERVLLFDWWMLARGQPENLCLTNRYPLPVGCYYVDTIWEATDFQGSFATIFNRSNVFCVRPA